MPPAQPGATQELPIAFQHVVSRTSFVLWLHRSELEELGGVMSGVTFARSYASCSPIKRVGALTSPLSTFLQVTSTQQPGFQHTKCLSAPAASCHRDPFSRAFPLWLRQRLQTTFSYVYAASRRLR